jgi:hypothetical protein
MANYINTLNIAAQQAALQSRIPGSVGLEQQSSQNIAAGLAGQIDPGTQRQIGEWAAARGIMSGSVGGPINDTAFLKLMSDTAYEREQQAQQNLNAAYARNPAAPIFDVSSQLLGPSQLGQLTLSQAEALSRERLSTRQQDEVERAAAVKESQLGRQLTEEERANLVKEALARAELEERTRSNLAQENLRWQEIAAANARNAAAGSTGGTTRQLPTGIVGPATGGDQVYRSLASGTLPGKSDWSAPLTAEDLVAGRSATPTTPGWGYQPTSQGTMYTGEVGGYLDPTSSSQDWLLDPYVQQVLPDLQAAGLVP